jgi:ribosome-associated translation inhibitor RaiA
MDSSEIIYVHSKFSKTSVNLISAHDLEINKLERQINKLKDELKTAIEYKQKLEFDKEKSKQILVMLNLSL